MAQIVSLDSNGRLAATTITDSSGGSVGSGGAGGSGGGNANAANQEEQTAVLEDVRDRLPSPGYYTPSSLIPNFLFTSGIGTIPAGASSVTIQNTGNADGVLLGKAFPPQSAISWSANGRDRLAEIDYDATGTTFAIAILA